MKSEWREVELSNMCSYRQERIEVDSLTTSNYISTANMLPDKGGIEVAEKLPNTPTTSRFYAGDVLISNIRPYFKKAWLAAIDGGCSNDVLVMKANENVDPAYLYYLLSSDHFFAYMTATSKGTKMPRGDKKAIMMYKAQKPPFITQKAIADTLSCLDAKIEVNNKIIKNLEAQAQAIFKSWFIDFEPFQEGEFVESELRNLPRDWRIGRLGDLMEITSGKRPGIREELPTSGIEVPVVGASKIMGYTNEVLFDDKIIVIGRVGTHGVIQRFDYPCWPSDNTLVIKPHFYEFVYQSLKLVNFSAV